MWSVNSISESEREWRAQGGQGGHAYVSQVRLVSISCFPTSYESIQINSCVILYVLIFQSCRLHNHKLLIKLSQIALATWFKLGLVPWWPCNINHLVLHGKQCSNVHSLRFSHSFLIHSAVSLISQFISITFVLKRFKSMCKVVANHFLIAEYKSYRILWDLFCEHVKRSEHKASTNIPLVVIVSLHWIHCTRYQRPR